MHDASPFGDVFLNTDEVIFETHTELTQQTCKCALRLSCIPYWTSQNTCSLLFWSSWDEYSDDRQATA